jgi:hypothetical protein
MTERVKILGQTKPGLCGPASLKAILSFYGETHSEKLLAELSGATTENGVGAAGLVRAATKLGFKAVSKDKNSIEDLKELLDDGPVIVNWFDTGGHYSVATRIEDDKIHIMNPSSGGHNQTFTTSDFLELWFDFLDDAQTKVLSRLAIVIRPQEVIEPLQKMAVKDIAQGKEVHHKTFSYREALKPSLQGEYDIHVKNSTPSVLNAHVIHVPTNTKVGIVSMGLDGRTAEIQNALIDKAHLGKGLGPAAYEALIAHAVRNHGVKTIAGSSHSTMSHRVHEKNAQKHGWNYQAEQIGPEEGAMDDAYGDYEYNVAKQELSKSEFEPTKTTVIQPFNKTDAPGAALAENALKANRIKPVSLGGKHSAGSSLFQDHVNNILWFLKPGSGGMSRALGVNEEKASSSRREVAFNKIAKLIGLQNYVPLSYLIMMDNQEVAMLEFFSGGYENLNKVRQSRSMESIFQPYAPSGLLHRLGFLDYLLGQIDRHAGNILIDRLGNFKLIDAGSTFAGASFSPATDPRSFIPVYLRSATSKDFNILTPDERMLRMPKPTTEGEAALQNWIHNLPEGQIINLLNEYGLSPQPVLDRLNRLKSYNGPVHEFLNKFWAGVI